MEKLQPPSPRRLTPEHFQENELFTDLTIPIDHDDFPDVRDAELYIRRDGTIVNAEGWYHPEDKIVGEVMYAPDWHGDRKIFGQEFRKLTLYPGTHTPVPYDQRGALLSQYDLAFDQATSNPYFAKYKQIFNRDEFMAYISSQAVFERLISGLIEEGHPVIDDINSISEIIGVDMSDVGLGFTGAPSFGKLDELHDLDLIFTGTVKKNLEIAKAMRQTVLTQPDRRLVEGGKGWNIRLFNDRRTLICSFFSYANPEDAPLRNFEMEVIEPNVVVQGEVFSDEHSIYTPTVLGLDNTQLLSVGDQKAKTPLHKPLQLIAYHTATRGECFEGDVVMAQGALVEVKTPTSRHLGVCVIEREGVRNLTPTWEGFYDES